MTMGDRVAVMRDGVLQQVAEPQQLYDHPANLFVAGFIGTPPMNLLEGRVSVNGGVNVSLGGTELPVGDEALKAYPGLRGYDGQTIVVGLRSQHLHPAAERPDLPAIEGRVELVEALGGESIVYLHTEATQVREGQHEEEEEPEPDATGVTATRPNLVAEFPAHTQLRLTDTISIGVDVARLHFFDRDSGEPLR
jgi:multiple sugar transport system ATP-binding protein